MWIFHVYLSRLELPRQLHNVSYQKHGILCTISHDIILSDLRIQ